MRLRFFTCSEFRASRLVLFRGISLTRHLALAVGVHWSIPPPSRNLEPIGIQVPLEKGSTPRNLEDEEIYLSISDVLHSHGCSSDRHLDLDLDELQFP